jgi:hypothetical protein
MLVAVLWVMFALSLGMYAKRSYNRAPTGWVLLAIIASPFIAVLILMVAGKKEKTFSRMV